MSRSLLEARIDHKGRHENDTYDRRVCGECIRKRLGVLYKYWRTSDAVEPLLVIWKVRLLVRPLTNAVRMGCVANTQYTHANYALIIWFLMSNSAWKGRMNRTIGPL